MTSYICMRRWLTTGHNFELLTGCDLNDGYHQQCVWHYMDVARPLVAVMAPTCAPFGPLGHRNRVTHPEAWARSYDWAAPHGRFAGHVALRQCVNNRFYFMEQPIGSTLYQEDPWPRVIFRDDALECVMDQCMVGQRNTHGELVRKRTALRANTEYLMKPFRNLQCSGDHHHGSLLGGLASSTQAWTWNFCSRVASGIVDLKRARGRMHAWPRTRP